MTLGSKAVASNKPSNKRLERTGEATDRFVWVSAPPAAQPQAVSWIYPIPVSMEGCIRV